MASGFYRQAAPEMTPGAYMPAKPTAAVAGWRERPAAGGPPVATWPRMRPRGRPRPAV